MDIPYSNMTGVLYEKGRLGHRHKCAQRKGHVKIQSEGDQAERPQKKPSLLTL